MEKKTSGDKYYEKILDWFKSQILSGDLKQGDVIPSERELAARFGVSRVPVREALRILEYIGIIRNTPEGMVVQQVDIQLLSPKADFAAQITRDTIEDLFEVRIFWNPRRLTMRPAAGRKMSWSGCASLWRRC